MRHMVSPKPVPQGPLTHRELRAMVPTREEPLGASVIPEG